MKQVLMKQVYETFNNYKSHNCPISLPVPANILNIIVSLQVLVLRVNTNNASVVFDVLIIGEYC